MEYTLKEFAKKLNQSEEKMKLIINDLLLSGLVEKNGDLFKLTDLGNNFMKFISDPNKKIK